MNRFLHFALLFVVLPFVKQKVVENGQCQCAVFPLQISESIIEGALQYNVTCDDQGEDTCGRLCAALGQSAEDKAPQMICKKLNVHVENLQVAVYSKICNATGWKYTGLKSAKPVCCHEGESTPCREPAPLIEDRTNPLVFIV